MSSCNKRFSSIILLLTMLHIMFFKGVPALPINDPYSYGDEGNPDPSLDVENDYMDYNDGEDPEFATYRCPGEDLSISVQLLCDGFPDCVDFSDEDNSTCEAYKNMGSTTESAAAAFVNPPLVKPNDKSDLYYGDYESCTDDQYQCPSLPSLCIPRESLCDDFSDCPDNEDELYCGTSAGEKKPKETLETSTSVPATTSEVARLQETMSSSDRGDSPASFQATADVTTWSTKPETTTSAQSTSDETPSCNVEITFQCRTRPGDCIPRQLLCDGYEDCEDGSDEVDCGCDEGEFQCVSGLCISALYRCNGINNCGDFSDEMIGCAFLPNLEETPEDNATQSTVVQSSTIDDSVPDTASTSSDPQTTTETVLKTAETIEVCQHNICRNGGTCLLKNKLEFICSCPEGYTGNVCEVSESCEPGRKCKEKRINGVETTRGFWSRTILFFLLSFLISNNVVL